MLARGTSKSKGSDMAPRACRLPPAICAVKTTGETPITQLQMETTSGLTYSLYLLTNAQEQRTGTPIKRSRNSTVVANDEAGKGSAFKRNPRMKLSHVTQKMETNCPNNVQATTRKRIDSGKLLDCTAASTRILTPSLSFPRFGGHYLKGGYDVQNANQNSG